MSRAAEHDPKSQPDVCPKCGGKLRFERAAGGLDLPVELAPATARARTWAAGVVYDPNARSWGGFLDRDIGPFRVGAAVVQSRPVGVPMPPRWDVQHKAGWRW